MPMKNPLVQNVFLFFISLLVAFSIFLGVDLALGRYHRVFSDLDFIQVDSSFGWNTKPNVSILNRPGGSIHTNSKGFRSDEIDPKKPQILILGDSVAWGYNVADHETAAFLLQNKFPNAQIQNMAVPGYGLDQTYLRFKSQISSFSKIQAVVLILSNNDIEDIKRNVQYGLNKPFLLREGEDLKLERDKIEQNLINYFLARSFFCGIISRKNRLHSRFYKLFGEKMNSEKESKIISGLLLEKIKILAQEKKADLLIVLSPSVTNSFVKSDSYRWFETYLSSHHFNFISQHAALKATGLAFDSFYLDYSHYSVSGNRLLAEEIGKHLT